MQFGILGPVEARDGERTIELGGRQRALLAVLLLHANEPVSADAIALALWGEDAPAQATKAVQMNVSRLRRALGDPGLPVTTAAGYRLDVTPDALDAERFRRLVAAGRQALETERPADAGRLLREGLALWRGPPLADQLHEPFAQTGAAALEEERLAAIELRVEADLVCGRHAELAAELQRLVAEHPVRERLHGQLMLALYRCDRQAEALEAYRQARAALAGGLGIEPSARLRDLERSILLHDVALDPASAPSPVRVPLPPTRTVGRELELARLRDAVAGAPGRLVTVVGPGGVGKTRLALELGHAAGGEWRDGAHFVSLAALGAPEHVASTIARELDIAPLPREPAEETLARGVERRELLLILDNFEHLLSAAPLVAGVLSTAARVTVLATSREPLRLRAERVFRLDPLPMPPARRLFAEVARAGHPELALSEDDDEAVGRLCRRLDGLPLAIELAASRLGVLSLPELERLVTGGTGALGPGARDAPARQRTLSATLDWSYALLSPAEQDALVALSVFAGGCTVEAGQAVTGASLEVLEGLVAKNLVVAPRRLAMLETVREFAAARLARRPDAGALRERHAEHFLALAERTAGELRRSDGFAAMEELDAELENLRAALTWTLDRPDRTLALRLVAALGRYWDRRELSPEAVLWIAAALGSGSEDAPPALRAAALEAYAHNLIGTTADHTEIEAVARESLELRRALGDRGGCGASLTALAEAALQVHRLADTYRYASEAERLAVEAGDEQGRIEAVRAKAVAAPSLEEALALGEQVAAADRAVGRRRRSAMLWSDLSYTALFYGDVDAGRRLSAEALAEGEALGDDLLQAFALGNAGVAALLAGAPEHAGEPFARQLRLMARQNHEQLLFEPLHGLAAVAAAEARDERAARLAGAAERCEGQGHDPVIGRQLDARYLAPARERLGAPRWRAAHAAGAALDRDTAVEVALRGAAPVPA